MALCRNWRPLVLVCRTMQRFLFFQVTSIGVAIIGLKPSEISSTRSRAIRETLMLTICLPIRITSNAGTLLRRRFMTASSLRASARQLFFFDAPQLFSMAPATQEGCVMFLRKTRRWMWVVDKLLYGYFWR